jgi:hypothetical protein
MRTTRWITLLVPFAFVFAACEPAVDEAPEAGEVTEAPEVTPTPPADVAPPAEPGVAARTIEVTNPMPHPMIVTATVDGETTELGAVPANQTAEFTVQARTGATVQLEARDEPDTHQVRGTVTVGETAARWTIRQ